MNKQIDCFIDWINEVYTKGNAGENPPELAANTDDYEWRQVYELTLNIPRKRMSLLQHIEVYRTVISEVKKNFWVVRSFEAIEYCKSGQPHMHAYLDIGYKEHHAAFSDKQLCESLVQFIYKLLPRVYYKQFTSKGCWNPLLRRWKHERTSAVCVNMKEFLHCNWEKYISKDIEKNARSN